MERAAAQRVQRAVMTETYVGDPGELSLEAYKRRYGEPDDTLTFLRAQQAKDSAVYKDIRTWYGAVWALRETEQRRTDLKRTEHVARYRPIQTLDGLDPDPVRLAYREMAEGFKALGRALRG